MTGDVRLRAAAVVPFPADDVAGVVLDWGYDARWRAAVVRFTCTPPGRSIPGQHLVEEIRLAGLPFRVPTTIVDAGPRHAAYDGGNRTLDVAGRRTVTALDRTTCRVDTVTHLRLRGAARVLAPMLGAFRRQDADDVAGLPAAMAGLLSAAPLVQGTGR